MAQSPLPSSYIFDRIKKANPKVRSVMIEQGSLEPEPKVVRAINKGKKVVQMPLRWEDLDSEDEFKNPLKTVPVEAITRSGRVVQSIPEPSRVFTLGGVILPRGGSMNPVNPPEVDEVIDQIKKTPAKVSI